MGWMRTSEALTKLPELILGGSLFFNFDGLPMSAENLPFKKRMNLIKVGIDKLLRSNRAHGLPPIIHIETTNICNLKCPLCPTGSNSLNRPKGVMSMQTFMRVLDELQDALISVYLFCFGEPFINKHMPQMIEECTARNILTLTSTNGHFVQTLDEALRVVDAGLTSMIIAIDGSTQEIYSSYRKGGDLERVKRCTALIEEAKARRGSKFPYTAVRCVVTHENVDDLPDLERLACDLGVNMFTYKSLGCLVNSESFKDYEPKVKNMRRFEYAVDTGKKGRFSKCLFPFRQPIVFWDGTVVGCEYDHDLEMSFGKVGEQSFADLWNSPNALKLRRSIKRIHERAVFCSRCPYEGRVQDGTALFCKELRPLRDK
jgi:radical SAM protein with 4Fe4S-binding SPASM domain